MSNKKGIIYVRVSSMEQTHGTSLESQERACREYAERNDIEIAKTFIEKGESATAANRTELIKALDYCREFKGKINCFIVWKIDRFSRNTTDHFALRAQLAKYNICLFSVTEPIGTDAMGKMMETMLAGYAQLENDIRKQRCEGGMQRRIAEGIRPWSPPLGYVNSKNRIDRRKTIPDEPDPERFFLVQKFLKAYSKGNYSITDLAKEASKWGLKTRTGEPMTKQLVEKALKDKFYAGILIDPWTGKEHQGKHSPMITLEEFEQNQRIKAGFSNHATRPRSYINPDFPLRRFAKCSCGKFFTGAWRKGRNRKYAYYNCNNKDCVYFGRNVQKDELENKFFDLMKEVTPDKKFLNLFKAIILDQWDSQHQASIQERQHYENELKRLQNRKERLMQMRLDEEISKEQFIYEKEKLENQIAGIQISTNEAKIEETNIETMLSFANEFIANLAFQWQEMDVKQKQRLQKLVLPEGIAYDKSARKFGTTKLAPIFELKQQIKFQKSDLVAWIRQNWNPLMLGIRQIYQFTLDKDSF